MNLLTGVPFAADLVIFVVCAVVIWVAGVRLSNSTDVLSDRLHLGSALGGLILLAVATNLPSLRSPSARRRPASSTWPSATSSAASRSRPWSWSPSTRSVCGLAGR